MNEMAFLHCLPWFRALYGVRCAIKESFGLLNDSQTHEYAFNAFILVGSAHYEKIDSFNPETCFGANQSFERKQHVKSGM